MIELMRKIQFFGSDSQPVVETKADRVEEAELAAAAAVEVENGKRKLQ